MRIVKKGKAKEYLAKSNSCETEFAYIVGDALDDRAV